MTVLSTERLRALAEQAGYFVDWAALALRLDSFELIGRGTESSTRASKTVPTSGSFVTQWAERVARVERVADLAQDDEDGNGWVPIDPLLDALYPERRIHVG